MQDSHKLRNWEFRRHIPLSDSEQQPVSQRLPANNHLNIKNPWNLVKTDDF